MPIHAVDGMVVLGGARPSHEDASPSIEQQPNHFCDVVPYAMPTFSSYDSLDNNRMATEQFRMLERIFFEHI